MCPVSVRGGPWLPVSVGLCRVGVLPPGVRLSGGFLRSLWWPCLLRGWGVNFCYLGSVNLWCCFLLGEGGSIPAPLSTLPGIQATQHNVFTFPVGPPHPPPYRHLPVVAAKPPSPKPSPSVGASKPPSTRSSPFGCGRPTTQHKVLHLLRGPTSQHVHHHP